MLREHLRVCVCVCVCVCVGVEVGFHHYFQVSRLSLYGHTGVLGSVVAPWLPPGQLHGINSGSPSSPCRHVCCVCIGAFTIVGARGSEAASTAYSIWRLRVSGERNQYCKGKPAWVRGPCGHLRYLHKIWPTVGLEDQSAFLSSACWGRIWGPRLGQNLYGVEIR